jgi:hypothetical protein
VCVLCVVCGCGCGGGECGFFGYVNQRLTRVSKDTCCSSHFGIPFRSENGILSKHDAVRYSNDIFVRPRSIRSSERRHFTGTHDIHLFHADDDAAQFHADDDRRLLLRANHHFEVYYSILNSDTRKFSEMTSMTSMGSTSLGILRSQKFILNFRVRKSTETPKGIFLIAILLPILYRSQSCSHSTTRHTISDATCSHTL